MNMTQRSALVDQLLATYRPKFPEAAELGGQVALDPDNLEFWVQYRPAVPGPIYSGGFYVSFEAVEQPNGRELAAEGLEQLLAITKSNRLPESDGGKAPALIRLTVARGWEYLSGYQQQG
ncbi:hypothetical protein [Deinococcus sonorensis]|uniref:Uncharacterized protein n=2 Tax=Deinococcus sonorensis TaxID=309891 RepID=A0AAU7UAJ7_9DEIO